MVMAFAIAQRFSLASEQCTKTSPRYGSPNIYAEKDLKEPALARIDRQIHGCTGSQPVRAKNGQLGWTNVAGAQRWELVAMPRVRSTVIQGLFKIEINHSGLLIWWFIKLCGLCAEIYPRFLGFSLPGQTKSYESGALNALYNGGGNLVYRSCAAFPGALKNTPNNWLRSGRITRPGGKR